MKKKDIKKGRKRKRVNEVITKRKWKQSEEMLREGEEEYRKRKHCKRNIENKEIKLRGKRHKVL